jgi:hypothetical protein
MSSYRIPINVIRGRVTNFHRTHAVSEAFQQQNIIKLDYMVINEKAIH